VPFLLAFLTRLLYTKTYERKKKASVILVIIAVALTILPIAGIITGKVGFAQAERGYSEYEYINSYTVYGEGNKVIFEPIFLALSVTQYTKLALLLGLQGTSQYFLSTKTELRASRKSLKANRIPSPKLTCCSHIIFIRRFLMLSLLTYKFFRPVMTGNSSRMSMWYKAIRSTFCGVQMRTTTTAML